MHDNYPEIYQGKTGHLFLARGHHEVLSYLSGERAPSAESVDAFIRNQTERNAFCSSRGIGYSMWIFPDKIFALRKLIPEIHPIRSLYEAHYKPRVDQDKKLSVFYPISRLVGNEDCFTLGDTHYSCHGEILVASGIFDFLWPGYGSAYQEAALASLTSGHKRIGDLGKKMEPQLVEKVSKLSPSRAFTVAKNGIPGNNGTMILLDSPHADHNATLLIFGDSFFRVMLMHLAHAFKRIVFCRTQFFHYELIGSINPDHVLCGAAERYLATHKPDGIRPHFLAYPLILGRRMSPDPDFANLFSRYFDQTALVGATSGAETQ
jgi:hypothetical protein